MASYSDVLKFEAEAPANTVRLIKSGEFYRAYNHSAWLFQCCIAEYRVMLLEVQVYVRLMCNLRYISQKKYALLMEHTSGMSRQLAAWEKSECRKQSDGQMMDC